MDEIFITDSGVTELLAPPVDVEVIVLEDTDQEIVFVGDAGIQGAPGVGIATGGATGDVLVKNSSSDYDTAWVALGTLGGDKSFSQDFSPATLVTVTHNLNKYPSVSVFTSAGDEVEADIEYISVNQLTVSFAAPTSCKVVCN